MSSMKWWSIFLMVICLAGCRDKYDSPVKQVQTGYLVVEGSVNNGPGNTTLKLSRTTPLNNKDIHNEQGATVTIEGDDSSVNALSETFPGNYSIDNLNLNSNGKYKLHIKTINGKEYVSDYTNVVSNPPIDSISYQPENDGLQIYVHTHNPQNDTRYYQWEFTETWEFHSSFPSILKYQVTPSPAGDNYAAVYKTIDELNYNIFACWKSDISTSIIIGSTAKLQQDVVYLPLTFITGGSQKLSVLYSIDIKQHSWAKPGYEFLERIKKNTEGTGSVFDAQPSEAKGNIHSVTDPTEPVIGYFNVSSSLQEKRFFIKRSDVPFWLYFTGCMEAEIPNISDSIRLQGLSSLPTRPIKLNDNGSIKTFGIAPPDCVDCTLTGSNIKPSFWP